MSAASGRVSISSATRNTGANRRTIVFVERFQGEVLRSDPCVASPMHREGLCIICIIPDAAHNLLHRRRIKLTVAGVLLTDALAEVPVNRDCDINIESEHTTTQVNLRCRHSDSERELLAVDVLELRRHLSHDRLLLWRRLASAGGSRDGQVRGLLWEDVAAILVGRCGKLGKLLFLGAGGCGGEKRRSWAKTRSE
jgi:hypothetical protein